MLHIEVVTFPTLVRIARVGSSKWQPYRFAASGQRTSDLIFAQAAFCAGSAINCEGPP
jgi:hypothetical protein